MKHTFSSLICAAALLSAPAVREASADAGAEVSIAVLDGWRMENGNVMAALHLRLTPGWHTYWRRPGEVGIPPVFDWSGSENLSGVTLHWPVPGVFQDNGLQYIGYEDELILPMELRPTNGQSVRVKTQVELGMCDEVCIPMSANAYGTLEGNGTEGARNVIKSALRETPERVQGVSCRVEPISDGIRLTANFPAEGFAMAEAGVIEYGDESVWIADTELGRDANGYVLETELVPVQASPFAVDRSQLRFSVIGGGRAVEAFGCKGS